MKKIVFAIVAFVALSFTACGDKTASTASVNDSDSVAVVDSAADSVVADSVVAE